MALKKIVVCDHIHQSGLKLLEEAPDINYINAADEPKDKLINEIIVDADVIITRSSTDVDTKLLERAKRLKAIVRAGVGVDNVDINECSKRGIIVMNVPMPTQSQQLSLQWLICYLVLESSLMPKHLKQQRVWRRTGLGTGIRS